MTWKEYFKEYASKMPQEFLNKEITIEDCLKIIDGMSFTIKELFDKKKWHTEEPTEDSDIYLVCLREKGGSAYTYTVGCTLGGTWLTFAGIDNPTKYNVVAWQKIEPFKEEHKEYMHIGTPYNVKTINAEVLTTEINIVENGEHTRYLANTYCIDEDTVF